MKTIKQLEEESAQALAELTRILNTELPIAQKKFQKAQEALATVKYEEYKKVQQKAVQIKE